MTWIKMLFLDGEIVEATFTTYVVNMWIQEKKPINNLRKMATMIDFKEL